MTSSKREWIRIARFELYPKDNPVGYAVGFGFSANEYTGYTDKVVSLEESLGLTPEQIVTVALKKSRKTIADTLKSFRDLSSLLGKEVSLPDPEPEEE